MFGKHASLGNTYHCDTGRALPRPERWFGCTDPGRLCHVLDVRVIYRGIDFGFIMALNTVAVPDVLQLDLMIRALDYTVPVEVPGLDRPQYSCAFFDYIIEDKVFKKF